MYQVCVQYDDGLFESNVSTKDRRGVIVIEGKRSEEQSGLEKNKGQPGDAQKV